jgi:hypothetical protein
MADVSRCRRFFHPTKDEARDYMALLQALNVTTETATVERHFEGLEAGEKLLGSHWTT